jgi:hypothetical protein
MLSPAGRGGELVARAVDGFADAGRGGGWGGGVG